MPFPHSDTRFAQGCFAFLLLLFAAQVTRAQNLESIGKKDPLKITGGISLSQIFYTSKGIESRRDPYSYFASGNVNFSLYGWNVPLSFSLSNRNVAFQQPFNQYSLHPTYKWVTAHIGYTSMSFSPYTLSGHLFQGAGVDLTPTAKLKFSAMYGRLLKAVEPDSLNPAILPAFKRMGYGLKASYGDGKDFAEAILFHASDQMSSIAYVPENENIRPQENLVMSIAAGKSIFKKILARAEYATTAITGDTRAESAPSVNWIAKTPLYTPRTSSSYYHALKASLMYQGDAYNVGLGYERIDPQYRTLGAYFFNNDLENITINAATSLFQGKVNVSGNVGTQRDNLDNSKISTMRRVVGSATVTYAPSQRFNLTTSYSNFQTFTNIRSQFVSINQLTPYDNLDTLKFTQVSQNATIAALYTLQADKTRRQNININLTVQDAADKQANLPQNSGVRFYNANTAYSLSLIPQNTTVSVSFNLSMNDGAGINSKTLGPTLAINRSFFDKKLRTTLSASKNDSYNNGSHVSSILNGRFMGSTTIKKKHNLNLSTVIVNRSNQLEGGGKSFIELTGTLGYSYSFGR
jgi:hypothetical protein